MSLSLRPATAADFEFCKRMYVEEARRHSPAAGFDALAVADSIAQRWSAEQTSIIIRDGTDIGWVQTIEQEGALFIRQFMLNSSFRGRGIGTAVMQLLMADAARRDRALTLGVVKTNRAKNLYERLGFRITHEDDRKFYMRWDGKHGGKGRK